MAFRGRRRFARRTNICSSNSSPFCLKIAASLDLDWETLAFLSGFSLTMAVRKRPAAAIINPEAVILKHPAQASRSKQAEYKQRVRSVCAAAACDKIPQVQHNGRGYCKICIKIVQPVAAAEALELRVEREAKRSRVDRSCYYCNVALSIDGKPYDCNCGTDARPSHVDMCEKCFGLHTKATCSRCWNRVLMRKCFRCRGHNARITKEYGRFCQNYFYAMSARFADAELDAESKLFLEKRNTDPLPPEPTGNEPALQLLFLPQDKALPLNGKEATYLSPNHCRLCFHSFPTPLALSPETRTAEDEGDNAEAGSALSQEACNKEVLKHLATHGLNSIEGYRKEVFSRAIGCPFEPGTNQVLRSRLSAYKAAQCDPCFGRSPVQFVLALPRTQSCQRWKCHKEKQPWCQNGSLLLAPLRPSPFGIGSMVWTRSSIPIPTCSPRKTIGSRSRVGHSTGSSAG